MERCSTEEEVNISSLVGNDTSTIPVGNVLILLKDIYKILQKELLSNMQKPILHISLTHKTTRVVVQLKTATAKSPV